MCIACNKNRIISKVFLANMYRCKVFKSKKDAIEPLLKGVILLYFGFLL